jgi:brefeldin A-inhibited guanine nucleotide-exchange protein
VIRAQIIGLELIQAILEKPKQSFLTMKTFIHIIKNVLCDGLLRYSVSNERTIFTLVLSIFYSLFLHFRKHLKNVILVFIETIFLKLLDSGNASYHHKHAILKVFDKISQNSMMLLEIFVNYDCDITQKDISKHIVESLSKIANGRFAKSEHKGLVSQQEELVLRSYSMQILCQMLRSFNGTIDAEIAERKISARMQHQ